MAPISCLLDLPLKRVGVPNKLWLVTFKKRKMKSREKRHTEIMENKQEMQKYLRNRDSIPIKVSFLIENQGQEIKV